MKVTLQKLWIAGLIDDETEIFVTCDAQDGWVLAYGKWESECILKHEHSEVRSFEWQDGRIRIHVKPGPEGG